MKITFFSNFLNHHQLPFCLEMVKMKNVDFKFVATEPIEEERIKLGYVDMNKSYDFVVRSYESEDEVYKLANDSDVVIIGSAPQKFVKKRLKAKKLTFRYSERIFKEGFNLKTWLSLIKHYFLIENRAYLLCASAYSAHDYNSAFCFKNRAYKWGYFPEKIEYDIENLLKEKQKNKVIEILWVGRFLWWKHPEKAIYVAKALKEKGINFSMKMVGIGDEMPKIERMIKEYNLSKNVELKGSVNYKIVRSLMEKANLFLFTSDYNEGWGAVLNEAMNSGCTVIASHAIGSVPFVVKHNYNGIIYRDENLNDLIESVEKIIVNKEKQYEIGINAYKTIKSTWNAEKAAKNLIKLIDNLTKENKILIEEGPCSKAVSISNKKMYNYLVELSDDKESNK